RGRGEAELGRDRASLGLIAKLADRELEPGELTLAEHVERVGLILRCIARAQQMPTAIGTDRRTHVVPGRQTIPAELAHDVVQQCVELHVLVARDTWIGRLAPGVCVDEAVDDTPAEHVGVVEGIEGNTERGRGATGILSRLIGPAAARRVHLAARRDEAHPYPDHVLAAVGEDRRGHRRVHAAAHGYEYSAHAIAFMCASTIAARSAPITASTQRSCSSSTGPICAVRSDAAMPSASLRARPRTSRVSAADAFVDTSQPDAVTRASVTTPPSRSTSIFTRSPSRGLVSLPKPRVKPPPRRNRAVGPRPGRARR